MRRVSLLVLVAICGLAAGCGSSHHTASATASPSASTSSSASTSPSAGSTDAPAVAGQIGGSVTGAYGTEPKIVVPTGPAPSVVTYRDIRVGTGTLATATSKVTVNYEGVDYAGGKIFDASWTDSGPASFSLDGGVIPGFSLGIAGMRVGGEREMVIPSAYAYGATGSSPAIAPNENLIFVVELVAVANPDVPAVKAVAGAIGGSVTGPLGKEPTVTVPTAKVPSVVTYRDIKVGTGATAHADSTVTVQYVGLNYKSGKVFDTSWTGSGPATFSLSAEILPGLQAGITGMKVGGRREIVIPSAFADGPKGDGAIAPNENLIFVIDLLKVAG